MEAIGSLVKGVLQNLPGTALSIKSGGSAQHIQVLGGLRSHGQDVLPFEQHGSIEFLRIESEVSSAQQVLKLPEWTRRNPEVFDRCHSRISSLRSGGNSR
jgi:hypothetical protein